MTQERVARERGRSSLRQRIWRRRLQSELPVVGPAEMAPELPRGLRQAVSALRHPEFARFWMGAMVSNCGTWMQNVTVPYVIYQETRSAALVGVTAFFQFIPALFLAPVGGWLADRYPRRTVLLLAQASMAMLALMLWAVYALGHRSPALLIVLVFLAGVAHGVGIPAWQAYVVDLVPRRSLLNAITLNSAQFNVARAVGPAIAGIVLAHLGASWAFLGNALSYGAVIVALASVRSVHGPARKDRRRSGLVGQMRESVRCVRARPGILAAVILLAVISGLGQPVFQLMPVFAGEVFQVNAARYGVMLASMGTGGVLGAVVLGSMGEVRSRGRTVQAALFAYATALFAVGAAPVYMAAVVALLVTGMLYLMTSATLNTSVQVLVPEAVRGGVIALYVMTFNLAYPVGSLMQGVAAEVIGPRQTVLVSAGLILVAALAARRRALFQALDDVAPRAS